MTEKKQSTPDDDNDDPLWDEYDMTYILVRIAFALLVIAVGIILFTKRG